jgi:hypothetical protein
MNVLSPNLKHAKAFLMMLDLNAKEYHFRTFDDTKKKGGGRNYCDTLENLSGTFKNVNQKSNGVFVVINDGGRVDAEITKIRAIFADTDGAPLDPIINSLEPHMVIETSPGKWHVYWLVDQDFPSDKFKITQTAIAKMFGTDRAVNNLSRVMRLPGFYHCKSEPFLCHIIKCNHKLARYSYDQIISGLQLDFNQNNTAKLDASNQTPWGDKTKALADLENILPYLSRCDYLQWRNVGFVIAEELDEDGRDLFIRWSRGDLERSNQQ